MKKVLVMIAALCYSVAAIAGTAFFVYETESGMHKTCYYDHYGDSVAITIKSYQLCPLTIAV